MSFRIRKAGLCCGADEKTYTTLNDELCIFYKFSPHSKLYSSASSFEMTTWLLSR